MTYNLDQIIEAVVQGSLDREIALYRVTFPAAAQFVMDATDDVLAKAASEVAMHERHQGGIDAAKIEIAYRASRVGK